MDAMSGPIADVMKALSELKKGNFKYSAPDTYQGDFGTIMMEINESLKSTDSYITEVSGILSGMANGVLTKDIKRDYIGQFTEIR